MNTVSWTEFSRTDEPETNTLQAFGKNLKSTGETLEL